jgi:hypothetical protein
LQKTNDKYNLSLLSELLVLFMMAGEFNIRLPQAAKVDVVCVRGKAHPPLRWS